MGRMFFNVLVTFTEFEVDLIRMRSRKGMAVARAKGKVRGKQRKLSSKQTRELRRTHETGDHSTADLAKVLTVWRATICRTLDRSPQ